MVAGAGLPIMGSVPTAACAVVVRPLVRIPTMMGGKNVGLLPTIALWKGSGRMPTMGLVGEVNKVGLD